MSTEQLKEEALRKVLDTAQATGDFVMEQAPEVISQLMLYHTITDCLWIVLLLGPAGWLWRRIYLMFKEGGMEPEIMMVGFAALGVSLVGLFALCDLIKLLVAPKVWLLEYAASLVK